VMGMESASALIVSSLTDRFARDVFRFSVTPTHAQTNQL
jgi:hypothetical protein